MTQQREAFEAWCVSKGISIERDGFGGYESHWTDGALEGWQAALQSQSCFTELIEAKTLNERYLTKVTEMHQDRDVLLAAASKAYCVLLARSASLFGSTEQETEALRSLEHAGVCK